MSATTESSPKIIPGENTAGETAATAGAADLRYLASQLGLAVKTLSEVSEALRTAIVRIRPLGLLTVGEMAEAVGRDRAYIDSVWSEYGDTVQGKQTRIAVAADPDGPLPTVYGELSELSDLQYRALACSVNLRTARNEMICDLYVSKTLRVVDLAVAAGIDRNHIGRILRAAGVGPMYRSNNRNQHTAGK